MQTENEDFELKERSNKVRYYLEKLAKNEDAEDENSTALAMLDPTQALHKAIKTNDITEIKKSSALPMQMNMLRLATEAESETVQYNATAYVLSQNGHGPVTKVDHNMSYAHTPIDQLAAIIRSKFDIILKHNPSFSIENLLSSSQNNDQNIIELTNEDV